MARTRCATAVRSFFFFFQAEDGIRDVAVTGVQTCALPILKRIFFLTLLIAGSLHAQTQIHPEINRNQASAIVRIAVPRPDTTLPFQAEIGRASCRERV